MNAPASGQGANPPTEVHPRVAGSQRTGRVKGTHEDRLSGLHDLLHYAQGASVLDIGINHGLVAFEFARRGAAVIHGCDIHARGVDTAREIFADIRTRSRFDVVDLTAGPAALETSFGADYRSRYDIVLFLGIYHQLKEQTSDHALKAPVRHLVGRTRRFFATRTRLIGELGAILAGTGLQRVHFSALSSAVSPMEIWRRN